MGSMKMMKVWKLKHAPAAEVTEDTFELSVESIPTPSVGEVLVETIYLSNDPSQRGVIHKDVIDERMYMPVVREGQIMWAYGIGKVVESRSSAWKEGDLVIASLGWAEYAVLHESKLRAVPSMSGLSPTLSLGALGSTGLTAYFGLHNVCQTKPEHTVVISGAAGSTGSAAVQIAKKMIGCKKVIGIAGGPKKCSWVKSLGADICLDYRDPNFEQHLIQATDGYVDVYLDLVGGEILDVMLTRMKRWGKIAAVGAIAAYNDESKSAYPNWKEVIANRLTITGFIVFDFMSEYASAAAKLAEAVRDGRFILEGSEEVHEIAFEQVPALWRGLFTGANTGKLVTKLRN